MPRNSNKRENKNLRDIDIFYLFLRYILLLIIGLFVYLSNLSYKLLLPITIYPSYLLLSLFYKDLILSESIIFLQGATINIIPSCVAASAYLLLLILNLTTPMTKRKRMISLISSFILLLTFNILRIFLLSTLVLKNMAVFNYLHEFFWYFMSILVVLVIWFFLAYLLNLKAVPIYSDINSLYKTINRR